MEPIVKLLAGLILIIAGLYWIIYYALSDFLVVLNGAIPPLVVVLGLFIVWLEWDEMKIERGLATERRKARRRTRRKR